MERDVIQVQVLLRQWLILMVYRNLWPISYRVVKLNLKLSCFEPISCDTSNGWGIISRYGIVALNISIAGQDLLNFKQPQIRFRTLPYIFLPAKSIYEWHCCPTEASKIILIHSHLLITLFMDPAKIPQCAPSIILKIGGSIESNTFMMAELSTAMIGGCTPSHIF